MKHRFVNEGFTLVEAMVVVALSAIISVSLVQSLTMGLKVWKRSAQVNLAYRDSVLGMERLAKELRQAINYPEIGFYGEKDRIEFASLSRGKIINISYVFDSQSRVVTRRGISRQEALELENKSAARRVISDARDMAFEYYGIDPMSGKYTFENSWNFTKSGIPAAVKTVLILESGETFEKIVPIYIAQ